MISMIRFLKQMIKREKGQALPVVLVLLVIGGLTIVPSLNYTTTNLKSNQIIGERVKGVYAADAGLEDALWSLANNIWPPTQLSDNVNQMTVNIQTVNQGDYTLYLGELIQIGEHNDYLTIAGNITWDEGAEAYKYTINITWQPDPGAPEIHLEQVGARLPPGYSYEPESAADFAENLSTNEPDETTDAQGAYMLNWELEPPLPSVSESDPVKTQIFYITGTGSQEGHYAWVVANREDIGAVGEISGTNYKITATAIRPIDGQTTAKIVAEVVIGSEKTNIVSWQIIK